MGKGKQPNFNNNKQKVSNNNNNYQLTFKNKDKDLIMIGLFSKNNLRTKEVSLSINREKSKIRENHVMTLNLYKQKQSML